MRASILSKGLILFVLTILVVLPSSLLSQTLDPAKLEQAKAGVLSVMSYNAEKTLLSKGCGFAIAENAVATAYHLVSMVDTVEVINIKGKKYKADGIIAADRKLDVAIIRVKGKIGNLSLTNSDLVNVGGKVNAVGPNEVGDISSIEATIRAIHSLPDDVKVFEASFGAPESFNGAPILDQYGQVLGLIIILDRRGRFVIPSNAWRSLNPQANVTEFKNWKMENYFSQWDGVMFAGRLFIAADDQGGAQKYLEKAISLNPSSLEAQLLLASVYVKQRDYQSALNTYKKATELDPSRADIFFALGDVQSKMAQYKNDEQGKIAQYKDAVATLESGLKLNPQKKEAYFSLGVANQELKEFAKAAEAFDKYINLKPSDPVDGYFRLGVCWSELGQFDAAIAALEEAVKIQPKNAKISETLADFYKKGKQYEKAEQVYQGLIQANPDNANFYYSIMIRMYDDAGNPAKAIESAKKLVENNPKSEVNLLNLGYFYYKSEKFDDAIEAFKKALELKPDYENAMSYLGATYSRQKKFKEAVEIYKKYVELIPSSADGHMNLGVSYMQLKNYKNALEPMQKTVAINSGNAIAQYNLALCYLNLQENAKAREVHKVLATLDAALAEKLKKILR